MMIRKQKPIFNQSKKQVKLPFQKIINVSNLFMFLNRLNIVGIGYVLISFLIIFTKPILTIEPPIYLS